MDAVLLSVVFLSWCVMWHHLRSLLSVRFRLVFFQSCVIALVGAMLILAVEVYAGPPYKSPVPAWRFYTGITVGVFLLFSLAAGCWRAAKV
jgi:hypothetical protein